MIPTFWLLGCLTILLGGFNPYQKHFSIFGYIIFFLQTTNRLSSSYHWSFVFPIGEIPLNTSNDTHLVVKSPFRFDGGHQ